MKLKLSDFLALNVQDFIKGAIVAIGGAVFSVIQTSIIAGTFTLDWNSIWKTALAAGVAYIGKNFFTPQPKEIVVDISKTDVIDSETKRKIA